MESKDRSLGFLSLYYLGTPAFLIVDFAINSSIRFSALEGTPWLKYLIAAFCLFVGWYGRKHPVFLALFSLFESAANIAALIIFFFMDYLSGIEAIADGTSSSWELGTGAVFNFLICGVALVVSFYRNPIFGFGLRRKNGVAM